MDKKFVVAMAPKQMAKSLFEGRDSESIDALIHFAIMFTELPISIRKETLACILQSTKGQQNVDMFMQDLKEAISEHY